jgi:protein-S-isoprenylcysteine O-methyltransferase Ste14
LLILIFYPNSNNVIGLHPIISQVLSILGFVILIISAYYLRTALRVSPIPKKNAPFIKDGIYRYISHPMYLGVILIALSIILNNLNFVTLIVFIFLYIVLRLKANLEEQLLKTIHKSNFEKKKTLFPIRGI